MPVSTLVIHFSDYSDAIDLHKQIRRVACGLRDVYATSDPARPTCPACQDRLARIASRAPVLVQSEERDEWVTLDNSANRPHVLHVEVQAVHRGALSPVIAKDFTGQLWEREVERSGSETCARCWGINPPEGVEMVPDDGAVCDCDFTEERGPILSEFAHMPNTYAYYASGRISAGARARV